LLSAESEDVFTDSLAQSIRELQPIITSKATIVAFAGLSVYCVNVVCETINNYLKGTSLDLLVDAWFTLLFLQEYILG